MPKLKLILTPAFPPIFNPNPGNAKDEAKLVLLALLELAAKLKVTASAVSEKLETVKPLIALSLETKSVASKAFIPLIELLTELNHLNSLLFQILFPTKAKD